MAVPPGVVDEIRSRSDLLNVIGDYVSLKKAGRNWIGLCPFHSEKTPSFTVSPEKGMFYCFGCGVGGDVFAFLRRIENLSFMESLERLAQRVGVEIPRRPLTTEEKSRKEDRERLAALVEEAAVFYHRILTKEPDGQEAREYLKKRGISIEMARSFRIGWAPRQWDALSSHLRTRGHSASDIEKAGLAVRRQTDGYYDRFRGRIMFSIMSVQGRVLGFGGRLVADEDGPKYMNSPESPLYQKSRVLYGLNSAHKAIREKDAAIIVEGYFDVLAMVRHGFENVVAPCGTALTVEQLRILTRYTRNIYPLFDADEAGDKARRRALEVILQAGAFARSAALPEGLDPDDFLAQKGTDALADLLDNAPPLLEQAFDSIISESGPGVEGRRNAMTAIAELLAQMSDSQAQEMYLRQIAQRFASGGSSVEDLFRKEVARMAGRTTGRASSKKEEQSVVTMQRTDMPDYYLLGLVLSRPELAEALRDEKEVINEIEDQALVELANRIIEEGAPQYPSQYLDSLEPDKAAILSKLIIEEPQEEIAPEKLGGIWADTVVRVKLQNIRRLKEDIQTRLAAASPDESIKLLRKKNELLEREKKVREKI